MESRPLPDVLRPESLDGYIGQEHLVGEGKPLRVAIENKTTMSFILWGPPGVGKTTLARIYAKALGVKYIEMSAVSAGKRDMRAEIEIEKGKPFVMFIDEIHRFNKAQQDFLLPYVESGKVILIGATTENPSFEVIAPLLSRCRVFVLRELEVPDLMKLGKKIEKELEIEIKKETLEWVAEFANGDARQFIGLIEGTYNLYKEVTIENLKNALQSKQLRYDKLGEEHYNTISSYLKSMRASNVDAALYYLARMVDAGEDPLFIARRMVVFASEDVAVPTALVVANAVFRACETVGYPECQENLAAGTVYLAQAPKDRRAYDAYMAALADVKEYGNLPIPLNLRNAPTKLMKDIGYGKGYERYSKEDLLPENLKGKKYYDEKQSTK